MSASTFTRKQAMPPTRPRGFVVKSNDARDAARERAAAKILNKSLQTMAAAAASEATRRAIMSGVPDSVISSLPWDDFIKNLGGLRATLSAAALDAGAEQMRSLIGVGMQTAFDVLEPNAIGFAQQRSGQLIVEITSEMRTVIRGFVGDALSQSITVDETARRIQQVIPLTERMAGAVGKMRTAQFDRLMGDPKMTAAKAESIASKRATVYAAKLTRQRAWNVARTEIMTASNTGRFESWTTSISSGGLSLDSKKEWTVGANPCEDCDPLDGEVVLWNDTFSNGEMMPPLHPSCRCTAALLPPDESLRGPRVAEKAAAKPRDTDDELKRTRIAESAMRVLRGEITEAEHEAFVRQLMKGSTS